jgi:glycosyltransferase involved in cell wall biosynthesis
MSPYAGDRGRAPAPGPARRLRVLVLSFTFPNAKQPALGVFVRERIRRIAAQCDVVVVAPVPWFPFNRRIRGEQWAGIAATERHDGLDVRHPRFFCIPRYLKWLDGVFYAVSLLPFLWRLRRSFPFDVIDSHFAYPDGLAGTIIGRIFRRPVVITLRGSIVRLATYPLHRPQLRLALRAAKRVVAVSESLKQTAVALGIPAQKVRVIPNGVDTSRFFPMDRREARRALDLPDEARILLTVGGLNEGKGQHRIVGMLPSLLRRHPDLLYVAVGGGRRADSLRPVLEGLIRDRGLHDHVLLAGERPHEEIPLWMAACDVFCLATRSEGWANVLLEALACGRPVVSTRVGGNAEIVTDPSLGTLVPAGDDAAFADALRAALARAWAPEALATHARQHSWDRATRDVLAELHGIAFPAERVPDAAVSTYLDQGLR